MKWYLRHGFLSFAPDNGAAGGVTGATAADGGNGAASTATTGATVVAPASGSNGTASTNATSSAAAPPATGGGQAASAPGVREAMNRFGVDLSQYTDDSAAYAALANRYQQAQQLEPLAAMGREYQAHAEQFRAWQAQQQEAERQRQAQAQQWWKPPEFDPAWESQLRRDPATGNIVPMPGVPQSVADKYQAFIQHQNKFQRDMALDPMKVIQPGVEQIATQIAQKLIQQHLGGYQQQVSAQNFVQQNSDWLHARDGSGAVVVGPTGQPQLSPLGQAFAGHVKRASEMGMNQQAQQDYALAMTRSEYLMAQHQRTQQGAAAVQTGQDQQAAFLATQAGQRGVTGAAASQPGVVAAAATPGAAVPMRSARDLAAVMTQRFAANGMLPGSAIDVRG